jgi:hypothetical protein
MVIVTPWFAYNAYEHGLPYLDYLLKNELVERVADHFWRPLTNLWFYALFLLWSFFPWWLSLIGPFGQQTKNSPFSIKFFVIWLVVIFMTFSVLISRSAEYYLLPLLPAAAFLIIAAWRRREQEALSALKSWQASAIKILCMALSVAGLMMFFSLQLSPSPFDYASYLYLLLALGGAVCLLTGFATKAFASRLLFLAGLIASFYSLLYAVWIPAFENNPLENLASLYL